VGRPTLYSAELAATICERLAEGETLRAICRDDAMPARSSVYLWLGEWPEFSVQYARAREAQADTLADEALDVSRESTSTTAQADRVKLDAIKWATAHTSPRKYGPRMGLDVSALGGGPVKVEHSVDADPDRLAALLSLAAEIRGAP
jgi:hypothetical protein